MIFNTYVYCLSLFRFRYNNFNFSMFTVTGLAIFSIQASIFPVETVNRMIVDVIMFPTYTLKTHIIIITCVLMELLLP